MSVPDTDNLEVALVAAAQDVMKNVAPSSGSRASYKNSYLNLFEEVYKSLAKTVEDARNMDFETE